MASNERTGIMPDENKQLAIFAVVLTLVSAGGYGIAIIGQMLTLGLLAVQFAPMLAAFAALLVTQRNLRGLGWRLGRPRGYLVALIAPFALVAATFALLSLFGLVLFEPAEFIGEAKAGLTQLIGWAPGSALGVAVVVLMLNGTLGLLAAFPAVGEELGWRGFLAPRLTDRLRFGRAAFLMGIIWAIYHYPLIHFVVAPALGIVSWPQMISSLIAAVGLTVLLNGLRLWSASVWPAVIFHAALNTHFQGFFDPMTKPVSAVASYFTSDYGFMIALVAGAAALLLIRSDFVSQGMPVTARTKQPEKSTQ